MKHLATILLLAFGLSFATAQISKGVDDIKKAAKKIEESARKKQKK